METSRDIAAGVLGAPPNFGDMLLPHVMTFTGMTAALSKTYRPSDEAIQHSWDNARFMRNDPAVMECIEARQRACALLNWHIEPENQKDTAQKEIADAIKDLLLKIPFFTQYRENMLHAIWYGRYGIQNVWRKKMIRRKMQTVINSWAPVHGDKLLFSWDKKGCPFDEDRVGIRVGWGYKAGQQLTGALDIKRPNQVEATEYGLAYFLRPEQRNLLTLHKHYIEDGEFETPDYAGRVHGVGVRSRIYWVWYQRQETMSWMMDYLERSGQGIDIFYFQAGNPQSEAKTRKAAEERVGSRNVILCPYYPEETGRPVYDHIEPSMAGASAMKEIVTELHGHLIKRYIMGQTLTSEQGSTGLGSNLADIHLGTFMQIIRYDATNLEERITNELVIPYIRYNFPQWASYDFQFRIDTESDDAKEKIEAMESGYRMGLKIKTQEAYDTLGISKPAEDDDVLQDPSIAQAQAQMEQQKQQAGAGGLPAGLTAKLASEMTTKLLGLTTREQEPAPVAGTEQPAQYSGTSGTPSQDSDRVKIRTYSDGDDPEQYSREAIKRHEIMLMYDADREEYRRIKSMPGQVSLFGTDEDWDENEHPRAEDGKFAHKGTGTIRRKKEEEHGQSRTGRSGGSGRSGLLEGLGDEDFRLSPDPQEHVDKTAPANRLPRSVQRPGKPGSFGRLPDSDGPQSPGAGRGLFGEWDEPGGSPGTGDAGSSTDGGRGSGGDSGLDDRSNIGGRSSGAPRQPKPKKPEVPQSVGNYRLTGNFAVGGITGYNNNIAALKVMRDLKIEDRAPDDAEKETLAKFIGWGQYPQLFNEKEYRPEWRKRIAEVRSLMGDEQYNSAQKDAQESARIAAARRSTLNAHYTNPDMVKAHWKINQRLGFKGGRFLEPSAGSGYYLGLMPEGLAAKTATTAVELDTTTGEILGHLYPGSTVHVKGFQDAATPDNFYDLVSSNVPFGDYGIHDPKYNRFKAPIHDYFFLKSVDVAKPGGIISHITSTGTLDKLDPTIRKELAKKCDFIGAIRMPNGAHAENAGTDVVTDVVILRKKRKGEKPVDPNFTPSEAEPKKPGFTGVTTDSLGRVYHWRDGKRVPGNEWTETVQIPDPAGGEPMDVNKYFVDNPQMVMGTIDRSGSLYGGNQKGVTPDPDWKAKFEAAIESLPENILDTSGHNEVRAADIIPADDSTKDGAYVLRDGKVYQRHGSQMQPVLAPPGVTDWEGRLQGQMRIRDAMQALIKAQQDQVDTQIPREALNDLYDSFVDKYGPLHARENRKAFDSDPDQSVVAALEHWDAKTNVAAKSEMFTRDTVNDGLDYSHADTVEQGLLIGLRQEASVNPEKIARLTGMDLEEVHDQLASSGLAFEDPSAGWQTASQYLSGNVRKKLEIARHAAASDPRYIPNVAALEKAQPADVDFADIEVRLGTPWIPAKDVADFAAELLGNETYKGRGESEFHVIYHQSTAQWDVTFDSRSNLQKRSSAKEVWATKDVGFIKLLGAALNNKPIRVMTDGPNDTRVLDSEATDAANDKVGQLKEKFTDWLGTDDDRRARLTALYNRDFNNTIPMRYDGAHQNFPGRVGFELRGMQKNFVWQVVTTGTGLAGHEVGTGKTASMIAAAMELRRLNLAKKPAILCLKSNIEQMTAEARKQYPNAKILSLAGANNAKKRNELMSKIATGDYDIVFMTHTNFGMVPVAQETQARFIRDEIDELSAAKYRAEQEGGKRSARIVKQLEKSKAKLEQKLAEALSSEKKDDALSFEQLGIDQIFVDEAHKFKSLPVYTSQENVKGIPTNRSDRATNMKMVAQWLQEQHGGRGVVFATGTPVANTMAELYNMQRYLQPQELKERGIENFDTWASTYGDMETRGEFNLAGQYKPVTRFSRFVNVPELMQVANQVMDVQRVKTQVTDDGKPVIKRLPRRDIMVTSADNEYMQEMMSDIANRAEQAKGKRVTKGDDNMLTITTDARKGAVDMRLLYPDAVDHEESKLNKCVANVLKLAKENPGQAQIIFSDAGVNKNKWGFSVYADIKKKLKAAGIKSNQIADFSRLSGAKKEEAQDKMRRGEILVAMGSTQKLGTGVNVQTSLQAIHHLDVPYVPADIEQRDGRGHRSGNKNSTGKISIYRYVQEGSADQISWQIVMRKKGFIDKVMNHKSPGRVVIEEDTQELTPEQMLAAASGDQRLLERLELEGDVRRLRSAKQRHEADQGKLKATHKRNVERQKTLAADVKKAKSDAKHVSSREEFELQLGKRLHTERANAEEHLAEVSRQADAEIHKPGTYSWNRNPLPIGHYKGMELHRDVDGGYIIKAPSGREYKTTDSLRGIENAARAIAKHAASLEEQRVAAIQDNERIANMMNKEFPHLATFTDTVNRLAALNKDIKENSAKKAFENVVGDESEEVESYALLSASFEQAFYGEPVEHYIKDRSGHDHAPAGIGGGRFVQSGTFGTPVRVERHDDGGLKDHGERVTKREVDRANAIDRPEVKHGDDEEPQDVFKMLGDAFSKLMGTAPKMKLHYSKDASGHEHKGKGPGGGQFTGSGGGGGGSGQSLRSPQASGQALARQRPQVVPPGKLTHRQQRQMPMVATHNQTRGDDGMLARQSLAQKTSGLSQQAVSALHAYTYHEHAFPLNDALRKDPTGSTMQEPQKQLYRQLMAALKEANGLNKPVAAYRGVDQRFASKAIADAETALNGSRVIEGHGISSLSLNPAKSVEYAKGATGVLYSIKAKSGAYVEPITRAKGEEELVHGHGKRYFVHGISEEDHTSTDGSKHKMKVIHLEELI